MMVTRDSDAPGQGPPTRLRFGHYVLDLERGCLLFKESEIALRPKTFAVLRFLSENSGRLVSKDELFAAVWPNLTVTDDALVQSIGELRRAFGDEGPRLIKTVPRRGYRFDSEVVDARSRQPSMDATPLSAGDAVRPVASATGVHFSAAAFTKPLGGPLRLLAASVFVVLLVAGAAWIGARTELVNVSGDSHESAAKINEPGQKPAIAVLPLINQNNDPARDYFADGLTQDIINALGRFPELTVMSWNAVFPYKDKATSPAEIARALAVRYQVEGSVRQSGNHLNVIAQLVDANGRVLWSDSFDEKPTNVFVLQDKITAQIAGALAIRVEHIEQRRVSVKPTDNLAAYDYVLRARPALQRPNRANIAQARALLKSAIEIDPNYAAAYAALAESYYVSTSMGWAESPAAFLNRAEEMAGKALSLDGSEVRAHVILGRIDIFHHRYEQALAEMDRAIAINPNDAHALAGRGNILMWRGETDAAIKALEQAQRIDPDLNVIDRFALSLAYYLKGRYEASIEQAESNLRKTEGANFSRVVLAAAYAQLNRSEDAGRAVTMIRRMDPTFDPHSFGSKFLNPTDLERLRDGLRKAGLYSVPPPAADR
jgi:TolB-like protein/DNA-binding winged helix-turn-helix (wHTH) protein/cytochrome c-type biogenesis protein CcmH/NrfG